MVCLKKVLTALFSIILSTQAHLSCAVNTTTLQLLVITGCFFVWIGNEILGEVGSYRALWLLTSVVLVNYNFN